MGSRTVVALSIIPLVLAACGAGATAPSGPASSFGPFDRAQVDNLTAQGLSEGQAIILAMSTVSVVSADDHSAHVVEALPTGETADIAIALTPASTGDPSVLTTTAEATPGGFAVTLRYFVPHATQASRRDSPSIGHPSGLQAWRPLTRPAARSSSGSDPEGDRAGLRHLRGAPPVVSRGRGQARPVRPGHQGRRIGVRRPRPQRGIQEAERPDRRAQEVRGEPDESTDHRRISEADLGTN